MILSSNKSNAKFDNNNQMVSELPGCDNKRHLPPSEGAADSIRSANIIGLSTAIKKARHLIALHSRYDAPVLVTGETGTGKELAARGLHYSGARAAMPFIPVNCATLTDELFASEVFGHVKGSFTDAKKDKKGLLSIAEKGTLFLDEIDSLSLKSQASLLRFLQEGEYRPVGSSVTYKSNARLIASANCDLEERIKDGSFRADLYYRLYILSVHMPPLRQRTGDIPVLVEHFIEKFNYQYNLGSKNISAELFSALEKQPWLGNVRELENFIHRLYLCSVGNTIDIDMLDFEMTSFEDSRSYSDSKLSQKEGCHQQEGTCFMPVRDLESMNNYDFSRDKKEAVEIFEKNYVEQVMIKSQGNVTLAAKMCGKERRAFGKLVKKYHIKKVCLDIDD